jgi:hypothetical protein
VQIVVYDPVLKRPGCALLQAVMGGTVSATLFPSESWLLAPTDDMKAYVVTDEELEILVTIANKTRYRK